jgi:hypothetical protein
LFLDSDAFVRDFSDWLERLMAQRGFLEPKRNGRITAGGRGGRGGGGGSGIVSSPRGKQPRATSTPATLMLVSRDKQSTTRDAGGGLINMGIALFRRDPATARMLDTWQGLGLRV